MTVDMQFKDVMQMYFERTNAMNALWGFYITVCLAILGFFGGGKIRQRNIVLAVFMSVSFFGFAWVNRSAIENAAQQRCLLKTQAESAPGSIKALVDTLDPPSLSSVRWFHLASDGMVILGMWYFTLRRDVFPG